VLIRTCWFGHHSTKKCWFGCRSWHFFVDDQQKFVHFVVHFYTKVLILNKKVLKKVLFTTFLWCLQMAILSKWVHTNMLAKIFDFIVISLYRCKCNDTFTEHAQARKWVWLLIAEQPWASKQNIQQLITSAIYGSHFLQSSKQMLECCPMSLISWILV